MSYYNYLSHTKQRRLKSGSLRWICPQFSSDVVRLTRHNDFTVTRLQPPTKHRDRFPCTRSTVMVLFTPTRVSTEFCRYYHAYLSITCISPSPLHRTVLPVAVRATIHSTARSLPAPPPLPAPHLRMQLNLDGAGLQ